MRQDNPIPPVEVESAPVQEVVVSGQDIDVAKFPICKYHELDAGKFITAGLSVMRDPDTGINNIGIYRHQVHARNLLECSSLRQPMLMSSGRNMKIVVNPAR